ncbi:MAG: pyridoxal phosphate-dependent aminotransferase [Candidatus Omnitrophota bacterium]
MNISKRINSISASVTLAISAKAKQMKADGIDVVGFGAGEPDFDTPLHIKEAAKVAIDGGFTKYTPASGTLELKTAVCKKLKEDNQLVYEPNEILISCGAKHSVFNAIVSLCSEGDEVIIPAPFWVSYPEMVKSSGARAVVIPTKEESGFKVGSRQLDTSITARTKLVILNSPSNPTGTVYTAQELKEIADVLVRHNVFCISDEIYEKIIYAGASHVSIASFNDKIKKLTVVVNGVSKAYSMTGWRIGYLAAGQDVVKPMANFQSHSTSNPTSISQKAALAALEGDQECVNDMVKEFAKRRDYIVENLNAIGGISCFNPPGAFYVFPNIESFLGRKYKGVPIDGSLKLSEMLLEEAKVAVVPGVAFGQEGFIRLSYATSMKNIVEGVKRIKEFVNKLN